MSEIEGMDAMTEHLRSHVHSWFGLPPDLPVEVRLSGVDVRRISHLCRFDVRAGGRVRRILVKVAASSGPTTPLDPATGADHASMEDEGEPRTVAGPPLPGARGERPRRSAWAGPARRFHLEHRALATIDRHFSELNDPRFGVVRVFGLVPGQRAVIMEYVEDPPLRDLILRGSLRRRPAPKLRAAFANSGAWLREYHRIPADEGELTSRHTGREDLAGFVSRVGEYLVTGPRDDAFFRRIRERVIRLAADAIPASPPVGRGHGDFAPRNILVGPCDRVTVLDTLGRFRTPVYEDIGYFLVNLKCAWPRVLGRGRLLPARLVRTWERALLEGYFDEEVPLAAVRLYEVQAMLDRWAAVVARRRAASRPPARVAHALRERALARFLRREIPARLSEAERALRSPASGGSGSSPPRRPRIAYVMSRFPKLTETFVLHEIVTLESSGVDVGVYPLLREHQPVTQPEATRWAERAHFQPFLSPSILRAQLHFIRRRPRAWFGALRDVLRGTWGSANFFIGAIGIFPKVTRFALEMQEREVRHVHAHFANHPALAAFIIRRLTGIPYSFTAHGSDLHVDRRMLDRKVAEAAFAVTISSFNREVMIEACGEQAGEKIRVIHCGIDTRRFAPPSKPRHTPAAGGGGMQGGEFRILCVASLEEVKGHRFLLEACARLAERAVPFRCELVGDGPLRRTIESSIVRLGLKGRVRLAGAQPQPEVLALLRDADAAALASHPTASGKREGIPVALMEAMACGVPVVATSISGIPELVEEDVTGLLVPSGDPGALAGALERLARDPELRERLGAAGRRKVLREFDLHANTRKLLACFGETLGQSVSPSAQHRLDVETASVGPS